VLNPLVTFTVIYLILKKGSDCFIAMTHMDKLRVFGKAMRVMLSKHQTVQLPKEGQPDAGLTRYFLFLIFLKQR
jgi:hypothetical protein